MLELENEVYGEFLVVPYHDYWNVTHLKDNNVALVIQVSESVCKIILYQIGITHPNIQFIIVLKSSVLLVYVVEMF